MPASPPPADDSEELDEDDVFAEDVLPALEPVELLVLVATTAVAAATAAAADGSRRFGLILLDIGLPFCSVRFTQCLVVVVPHSLVLSPSLSQSSMCSCNRRETRNNVSQNETQFKIYKRKYALCECTCA